MKRLFLVSLISLSFKVFSSDCCIRELLTMDGLIKDVEQEAKVKAGLLESRPRFIHERVKRDKFLTQQRQNARDDKDFRSGIYTTRAVETANLQRVREAK